MVDEPRGHPKGVVSSTSRKNSWGIEPRACGVSAWRPSGLTGMAVGWGEASGAGEAEGAGDAAAGDEGDTEGDV